MVKANSFFHITLFFFLLSFVLIKQVITVIPSLISDMVVFYDDDWYILTQHLETQFEFVEIELVIMDNLFATNPINPIQGEFAMELNETFADLKFAIEEAIGIQEDTFFLVWNGMELWDQWTLESVEMNIIAFDKPFKLTIKIPIIPNKMGYVYFT